MRKENIIFALINTERYKEGLASIPHKEFEDLSIVYYEFHPEQALYRLIKNEDMENDNLTEEELYELGFENTRRIMVPKVVSMSDMIRELAEEMGLEIRQEANMHLSAYVITNEQRQRGAANILYGDIMENVSQKLGGDLCLIPCSVNEFIATPMPENMLLGDLQELVHFTNMHHSPIRARLSNQLYRYDSTTKQIKQATFSPYTNLNEERPQWSEWILNEEEVPKIECEGMEENSGDIRMGI